MRHFQWGPFVFVVGHRHQRPWVSPAARDSRSSTVESDNLDRKTYRLLGLSTGELPLESYGEREEGERVRYPDIPVPPVGDNGIFDHLANDRDAAALAAQVEETIRAHHGVAYEAFIERLVLDRVGATADAHKHVEIFLAKAIPEPPGSRPG